MCHAAPPPSHRPNRYVKSKFNTGGGFAASVMKNIDSGTTRLTYTKNRFNGMLDEAHRENNNNAVSLDAPCKVSSTRFGSMMNTNTNNTTKVSAFPGLSTATNVRQRGEIRRDSQRQQMELAEEAEREGEKKEAQSKRNRQNKQKKLVRKLNKECIGQKREIEIDLNTIYWIIYEEAKDECLALVLEVLSQIELRCACLGVVDMIGTHD
eukprot:245395_1